MTALAMDVRELTFDEVEDVAGGPIFVALVPFIPHIVAGVATVAVATIAAVSHLSSDDCVTTTTTNGNTVTESKRCT
ncbi:hypothetical protein [Brevundimonas sp. TWP2-3-4b2]|uniref:hypothetical protein n=1 Tax=Brevundimonas sp. TWP2-3-4b2 TaxID=2804595 RepID=UPI003CF5A26C